MLDKEQRLLVVQGKVPIELRIEVSDDDRDDGDGEDEEEEENDVSDVDSVISRQADRTAIVENHDFVRF